MKLPRIAVTMGDPAGIGPEICLRLLAQADLARVCTPVVLGDIGVLRRVGEKLKLPFDASRVVDLGAVAVEDVLPGRIDARCGEAAYRYVVAAINAALAGEFDAIATAPLHKEALHAAGYHYPGHTEIFAERMQAERFCMMLTAPEITCSLVTVHVGLGEVAALLTEERIGAVIDLTAAAMRRLRGREPRLVVCGLNPHAGEGGLFGQQEEERIIAPAVAAARAAGLEIVGPLPPDTAFLPARRARTEAYICMYHDQGLIPLKALAFDSAINITLGLPIVRTSVDHGTAFDIAWQGKANPASLEEAVRLAARLCA
jgi:4-hydroxythreonine-4-phosphate dehydrogenase